LVLLNIMSDRTLSHYTPICRVVKQWYT